MKTDLNAPPCPCPGGCSAGIASGHSSRLTSGAELKFMDRMPLMVFVLGPDREITYGNDLFLQYLQPDARARILGQRLGEALGCVHVHNFGKRCGTTPVCRHCGAAHAILKSLRGIEHCEECQMTVRNEEGVHAVALQILARPWDMEERTYSLCTALDISHERALEAQQRTFLHAMINAAGGMEVLLALTGAGACHDLQDNLPLLHASARTMLEAVLYQYDVVAAESGQLEIRKDACRVEDVVTHTVELARLLPAARGRVVSVQGDGGVLHTDVRLLRHVLGALVVNALEAVPPGGEVRVRWGRDGSGQVIFVDNAGHIPGHVQAQLFARHVSTKGRNRGLGLHMARIFAETYLGGRLELMAPDAETVRLQLWLPLTD